MTRKIIFYTILASYVFTFINLNLHAKNHQSNDNIDMTPLYKGVENKSSEVPKNSHFNSVKFDFNYNLKNFDFSNAFWLATLAYLSYFEPSLVSHVLLKDKKLSTELPHHSIQTNILIPLISELYSNLGIINTPLELDYYTSHKSQLGENVNNPANYQTRWVTPFPAEACIKPECNHCFLPSAVDKSETKFCNEKCSVKTKTAFHSKEVLLNIVNKTLASEKLTEEEQNVKKQVDRYVEKFNSKYPKKKLELNGAPIWLDKRSADRCIQHTFVKEVIADTQSYIIESEKAIFVVFRGTEDRADDYLLDLGAFEKKSFRPETNMKGAVHKGFYKAIISLRNYISETLIERLKKSPEKPIFIAGHSLGGAIGHLTLYSLLASSNESIRKNLKAIYTFGAPRVGNKEFAEDYERLTTNFGIGIYNIVNKNDIVPEILCIDYTHVGQTVQFDFDDKLDAKTFQSFSKNPFIDHSYKTSCQSAAIVKDIFNLSRSLNEHKMKTYLHRLAILREQLTL